MLIEIFYKTIEKRYLTLAKETKLDDSADIYVKREKKTEKQKLSEMSFKETEVPIGAVIVFNNKIML